LYKVMECKGIFKFDDIWNPDYYIISLVTNIIHTSDATWGYL
jgi:hypothetical protein